MLQRAETRLHPQDFGPIETLFSDEQLLERLEVPGAAEVGGASDGNFTAAIGVPTLDGLGALGGNAHAEGEWVDTTVMADRAALAAELLDALTTP